MALCEDVFLLCIENMPNVKIERVNIKYSIKLKKVQQNVQIVK